MFKNIFNLLFNPTKKIILNKSAKLHHEDFYFLSMVKDKNQTRLWVIHHTSDDLNFGKVLASDNPVMSPHKFTNREHHLYSLKFHQNRPIKIINFKIENQIYFVSKKFSFKSHKFDSLQNIIGFEDKDLIPTRFFQYDTNHVIIREYLLGKDALLPKIKNPSSIKLSIKMDGHHYTYPVEQVITLTFQKDFEKELVLQTRDDESCRCFFHPLSLNNIHVEEEKNFDPTSPKLSHLTPDQIVELKQLRAESILNLCPKDKVLAMANYEMENNYSMEIFLSEDLDVKPAKKDHTASVTITQFRFDKDDKFGKHGLRNHASHLKPVSPDYASPMKAEIMTLHKYIPGDTYNF